MRTDIMTQYTSRLVASFAIGFAAVGALAQPTPAPLLQIESALIEDDTQTSAQTRVQKASPYYIESGVGGDTFIDNRGTGLDGSLRSPAPFGWVVNANPYAHDWNDKARYRSDFLLNNGRYSPTHIDLALPAPGFSWTVGRTYSIPAEAPYYDTSTYTGPEGYQGLNWHQFSQPELVFSTEGAQDEYIYIVYGADRFLEFKLVDGSSTVYRGVNGTAGAIVEDTFNRAPPYNTDHDTLTYWDQHGTRTVFYDPRDSDNNFLFSGNPATFHDARGQIASITDADGNTASVTLFGYDEDGKLLEAFDTAGRRYDYTYSTVSGGGLSAELLTKVEVFQDYNNDNTWETTGSKVEYEYYSSTVLGKGIFGNLKEARVFTPLSGYDPAQPSQRVSQQKSRYWYQTVATDYARGYLKVYLNPEGYRRFENEQTLSIDDQDVRLGGGAGFSTLAEYCEFYIPSFYDSFDSTGQPGRIKSMQQQGEPGSGGFIDFEYHEYTTFSNTSGYDPEHRLFVGIDEGQVGLHRHLYFDEAGQPLSERIEADGSYPAIGSSYPDMWIYVDREAPSSSNSFDGVIWKIGWPMSLQSADPNPAGATYVPPCTFKSTPTSGDNGGVVSVFDREVSTTSAFRGFQLADQWQHGNVPYDSDDGPHSITSQTYLTPARDSSAAVDVGGYLVIRPLLSGTKRHPEIDIGGGTPSTEDTTFSYEFHAEAVGGGSTTDPADPQWLSPRKITTTLPMVSTSQLGSGVSETTEAYYRPDSTMVFYKAADDIWRYTEHDRLLEVKSIVDADLSATSSFATGDAPSNFMASVPSTLNAYHLVTECVRDEMGRKIQHTLPTGRVQEAYHSKIGSGELTTVWSAKSDGGTHSGPASYVAYDHLGSMIVNAQIAFAGGTTGSGLSQWLDDEAMTPLVDAVSVGVISRADTVLMEKSGQLVLADRSYHTMPTSGIGTRSVNFDERWHEYDRSRRIHGTVEMNGTIRTYDFDDYGGVEWINLDSYNPGFGYGDPLPPGFSGSEDPNDPDEAIEAYCLERCCGTLGAFPVNGLPVYYLEGCNENLALTDPTPNSIVDIGTGQTFAQGDMLGRTVFKVGPHVPYEFLEYDNLGRLIAVATYKGIPSSFVEVATLPTKYERDNPDIFSNFDHRVFSPSSVSDNRLSLVEYEYTPRGQLYKQTTYAIDSSGNIEDHFGGSSNPVYVQTVNAYDQAGRPVYTKGAHTHKRAYNRIGQLTDTYVVAVDDDTPGNYGDLFGVDGEVVVSEQHAAVDPKTGNTHMVVRVDRVPDISGQPQPLDALDGSDYSDISTMLVDASMVQGRAQIMTYTYDDLDRVTGRSIHGTGDTDNNNDFDPDTPPAGSLDVSLTYGDDGRVDQVTDELGRVQKRSYDLAGKLTRTIDNYVASGTAADENRKTEWEYRHTQLYQYHAYLDDTTAQITTYDYGSPHERVNPDIQDINPTNDVLRSITYPDGDEEQFFYDNYGTLNYHIDRHDNEFQVTFDDSHRPMAVDVVVAGPNYGSDLSKSIDILYTDRGRYNSVTELDNGVELSTVSFEYDNWGALKRFTQIDDWLDNEADIGVVKPRAVDYVWETSATSGPSGIRLDTFIYEGDPDVLATDQNTDNINLEFNYTGGTNSGLSRVTSMALDGVTVADYDYIGLDRVSRIDYPENDIYSDLQSTTNTYDTLDRFNRVTKSRWSKELTGNDINFYSTEVHWDAGSNVTGITDLIHTDHWNFNLVNDDLDRLTQAKRGGGTGTIITNLREQEDWTLGKVGTWESHDLDLNGGTVNYSDPGDFQRDHTFDGTTPDLGINQLELIEEDTDNVTGYENSYDRVYDSHSNVTSAPDRNQEFVWDYLNRLIEIKADDDGTMRTVAEFRYNALGWRIAERLDSNGDGFLDKPPANGVGGPDTVWRRLIYDARWRIVEVYEVELQANQNSEDLVERFVHHGAGLNGAGTGSYIDAVVLRDRDTSGDATLDERHYYCQNWRADVVAIIDDGGSQVEQMRYSPYGTPYSIPFADQDLNGAITYFDVNTLVGRVNSGIYDVRSDINLDGALNFFDVTPFTTQHSALAGNAYGRGVQSAYGHEPGYAGYWRIDQVRLSHVRNRWYDTSTGSWLSKDPAGYVDGSVLFQYGALAPYTSVDPFGLNITRPMEPGYGGGGREMPEWGTPEQRAQWYRDLPGNLVMTGTGLVVIAASPEIIAAQGAKKGVSWTIRKLIEKARERGQKEIPVSRWGRDGLAPGAWVMKGPMTRWRYWLTGKWEKHRFNEFACYSTGRTYYRPRAHIRRPHKWNPLNWPKYYLFRQWRYVPPKK